MTSAKFNSFENNNTKNKDKAQYLTQGLSIGISRQRERYIALQKERHIKIIRAKITKISRTLFRDKALSKQFLNILKNSGLSLEKQLEIAGKLKKLIIDISRGIPIEMSLEKLKMNLKSLPLSIRRYIVSLIVLQIELRHLKRLREEREFQMRRELQNAPRLSIDDRDRILLEMNTNNHEHYAVGLSKTSGRYDGIFDRSNERQNNDRENSNFFSERTFNNNTKNYKEWYNFNTKKEQNSKKQYKENSTNVKENQKSSFDKDNFYNQKTKEKNL